MPYMEDLPVLPNDYHQRLSYLYIGKLNECMSLVLFEEDTKYHYPIANKDIIVYDEHKKLDIKKEAYEKLFK